MSNFDKIPAIVYAQEDGSFTKKWDTVLLTGEVYRAKTRKKHLKAEDKSFDISIKLTPESFKQLKALKLDSTDKKGTVTQAGNRPLTGLKQVKLAKRDEDGNPLLDDMDEPIKEFSHCQITLRQNRKIGDKEVVIAVQMIGTNANIDDILAEGTKVTVEGQCYETVYRDNPAMGLNLKSIRVHELVKLEGGGDRYDPWAAIGMSAPVAAEEPEEEKMPTQAVQAPAPVDSDDDEELDDPF